MIRLFGIANCDTSGKTRKWLRSHRLEFEFHDYKKAGCPADLVRQFLEHFSWQDLVNTRGTTWRKLSDAEKSSLDTESAIELMQRLPSIIKRPLIQTDALWVLGFNEKQMHEAFAQEPGIGNLGASD